jgi:hypothetical protein
MEETNIDEASRAVFETKDMYTVPVHIYAYDPSLKTKVDFEYKEDMILEKGKSFRDIMGPAIEKATGEHYKKYPAHTIEEILVDAKQIKFSCKIKVKKQSSKSRKPRARKLPFSKESKEKLVQNLGHDRLGRRYIETVYKGRQLIITLLEGERDSFDFKWNRLIITCYQNKILQYVKILSEDIDGNPVLVKWDLSSLTSKHPRPYVEHLWSGGNFSNSLPIEEYKSCIRIAKTKFKKYLKEVRRNEK